jgi:hypothetical protein
MNIPVINPYRFSSLSLQPVSNNQRTEGSTRSMPEYPVCITCLQVNGHAVHPVIAVGTIAGNYFVKYFVGCVTIQRCCRQQPAGGNGFYFERNGVKAICRGCKNAGINSISGCSIIISTLVDEPGITSSTCGINSSRSNKTSGGIAASTGSASPV